MKRKGTIEERKYTVFELAEKWGVSHKTISRIFATRPGVLKIRRTSNRRKEGARRDYISLRIPESVAREAYKEYTQ